MVDGAVVCGLPGPPRAGTNVKGSFGSADRDGHLRSGDLFDVENRPTWTFTSTSTGDVDQAAGTFVLAT